MKEEEIYNWIFKILIPSIVGAGINVAIVARKKTMSVFNIISSFGIGIGFAYLCSDFVSHHFNEDIVSIVIGAIAMSGEKIGSWIIFKLDLDEVLRTIFEKYYKK